MKKEYIFLILVTLIANLLIFMFSPNILFSITLLIFSIIVLLALKNFNKNIFLICFLISFFTFLLGRPIVTELFGITKKYVILLSPEATNVMYMTIICSLLGIMIGYFCNIRLIHIKGNKERNKYNQAQIDRLKSIVKFFTIIFYLFTLIEYFLRFYMVRKVGYTASYALGLDYRLPGVFHIMVEVAPLSLAIFLATLPTKKEIRIPLILFVISLILCILAGRRFEIVSGILFIFIYLILRDRLEPSKKWINKKILIFSVCLIPIAIILLQGMVYWRDSNQNTSITPNDSFLDFLYGVGGSSSLVGYVDMYSENVLSDDVIYSFGNIWRAIHANAIAKLIGVNKVFNSQTKDLAINGHSLEAALTYHLYPNQYLSGYGLGGCYIAELFHDWSYFGVFMGNLFIGILLKKVGRLEFNMIFNNSICLFLALLLLRLPRDSFDYFISEFVGLKNILFVIVITIMVIIGNKKKKGVDFE